MTEDEVRAVYLGSDAEATRALYARLHAVGDEGKLAVDLMRAGKASGRAKQYKGGERGRGSYRSMAYEKKEWAMGNLCTSLTAKPLLEWGWGIDERMKATDDPFMHVLYIETPIGQVSFHTSHRMAGPSHTKPWDGLRDKTALRIVRWSAMLLGWVPPPPPAEEQKIKAPQLGLTATPSEPHQLGLL